MTHNIEEEGTNACSLLFRRKIQETPPSFSIIFKEPHFKPIAPQAFP
jgi:hypothetical protein